MRMVEANNSRIAMPYPGSNIFGQTFFKHVSAGVGGGNDVLGEYRYTSELIEMRKKQAAAGGNNNDAEPNKTLLYGYFHPDNEHYDSNNN